MSTAKQYTDKQIMDLSSSQSAATAADNNSSSNNNFIDFINVPPEEKGSFVASYDFMPIQSAVGFSSPPADRSSKFDSGDDDTLTKTWKSVDSKINASPVRNYGAVGADESILGKNANPSNATLGYTLVSEIDLTMKKYTDNLLHALDSMSARLSKLETRTHDLENSVDDLRVSVGNNHGNTDGKLRFLENVLREVQSGVLLVKDKQEILEARLEIAKLQVPKVEQKLQSQTDSDSTKAGVSAHQQVSAVSLPQPQPHTTPSSSNAPQPPTHQNMQWLPNQFPQYQVPSVPQQSDSYIPNQTPDNPTQRYQMPPPQPQHQPMPPLAQHQPMPPLAQHQYHSPTQYSQSPPSSQPHPSFLSLNPVIPQPQLSYPPEETSYIPPQASSPGSHLPTSHSPTVVPPPPQEYHGPHSNLYEPPPSSRSGPGYPGSFGPSSVHGEPYLYTNSPSQYSSGPSTKPQQLSSHVGTDYPQLPKARILPQALPTASPISGSTGSGGSGNRVPNDDIIDKVTNMGFPRDQVGATIRKLTESGQAVDLNVVLDKLMNDGF